MEKLEFKTIDEYIDGCDLQTKPILQKMREVIKTAAPDCTEKISWGMPTFYQKGNIIHFFAYKKHIGVYPGSEAVEHFAKEFEENGYKYSKGAVQFLINKPVPYDLITKLVEFSLAENLEK